MEENENYNEQPMSDAQPIDQEVESQSPITTPEEPSEPSARDRLKSRLKEYDPEGDYDDDDNFYNGLNSYAEGRDREIDDYRNIDKRLQESIQADPHAGLFIVNLLDGMDFMQNLYETMGPELADIVNSPDGMAKREELQKKAIEVEKERAANEEVSMKTYEDWATDKDEDDLEEFGNRFSAMLEEMKGGVITKETLDAIWKGFNFDAAVAVAADNARIQGRNERISAQMRSQQSGDGVPSLDSYSTAKRTTEEKNTYATSPSIWERGK